MFDVQTASVPTGASALLAEAQEYLVATKVTVKNTSANPVYVGPAGVTVASGYEVAAGAEKSFTLAPRKVTSGRDAADVIHAITSHTAAVNVQVVYEAAV